MTSNTSNNNNNNINMNLNMNNQQLTNNNINNNNNPSPAIQQLAQRQMQNMNPALKEYKNQLFQQQQQQIQYDNNMNPQQQGGRGENDDGEPSDLDNTNLYIKGLWKDCTQVELDDLFKQFGVICQSRVYGDGVGFVRFETGKQAKAAIDTMDKAKLDKCQDQLLVKYAFKKQRNSKRYIREVEMIMNKNTNNVYLRCLPRGFTEKQLIELCDPYGELTCTRLRESGVAFVRYRKAEDAQTAIRSLNGKRFDGQNETLLAKLANSDPFQPKIGFKQRPFDEEDISSVPESTNTMTPSQGPNDTYNQQQIGGGGQQKQSASSHHQQQSQQQMNKQQQQLHHAHNNQYGSHTQYQPHHNPSSAYGQQQAASHHTAPPVHHGGYGGGSQYDQHHGGYNHYGPPPNTQHTPYDAHNPRHVGGGPSPYNTHYGPPAHTQQPAPYPHNYTNPTSAYPPPQPQQPPYTQAAVNNGNTTPNQAQQGQPPIHTYAAAPTYYQPYPGYSAYYAPQPTYTVPQPAQQPPITPQPGPPQSAQPQSVTIPQQTQPPQQSTVSISTAPQTITSNTSQPGTTTASVILPSAPSSNAAPTTVTSVTTVTTSSVNASQKETEPLKSAQTPTKETSKNTATSSVQSQQKPAAITPPKSDNNKASSTPLKPPSILTPNISNVSNLSATAAKPVAPTAIYVPTQAPNGQIMYAPAANSAVLMTAAPFIQGLQSPPGSELSFRHHTGGPGSELSSIAGHAVSDIIASHHPLGINASKVAGRHQAIPITPEKTSLQTAKISPYANLPAVGGHISPGPQNYASPAHQWRTAANAAFAVQPQTAVPAAVAVQPIAAAVQPPTGTTTTVTGAVTESGGIEAAKQGPLAIVQDNPITNALAAAVQKGGSAEPQQKENVDATNPTDTVPELGNLPAMEHKTLGSRKTSNPHDVSKECANKLHGVISSWYPQKAGKLTGMFLQNHDEDKVVKYLKRPEKLKKKIDTFVNLLSNSMPKAPSNE